MLIKLPGSLRPALVCNGLIWRFRHPEVESSSSGLLLLTTIKAYLVRASWLAAIKLIRCKFGNKSKRALKCIFSIRAFDGKCPMKQIRSG